MTSHTPNNLSEDSDASQAWGVKKMKSPGCKLSIIGIISFICGWTNRQSFVQSSKIANLRPFRFCWYRRLWSEVIKASNLVSASANKSPFFNPSQPSLCGFVHWWDFKCRLKGQGTHSSSKIFTQQARPPRSAPALLQPNLSIQRENTPKTHLMYTPVQDNQRGS